jgi:outer membrane protein TolC
MKRLSRSFALPAVLLALSATALAEEPLPLWEAMSRALQANPAFKGQQLDIDRQDLEQEIARGQHLPKVDLTAGYARYAYPSLVTPIRQAGVFPPLDRDIANIGLALSLPLYAGGRLVAGEALAEHNREAATQAVRASGQDLLFNVVSTYTKALHFRNLEKTLDLRIKALEREEKDIIQRIDQGRAAKLELIRLQTQLSQARHDRVIVRQGESDALSLLATLLGETGKIPAVVEVGRTAPVLPATMEDAIGRAQQQRPDVLKFQAQSKAAQDKVAIAQGDRLPQVNLVGKVQETSGGDWKGYDDWQLGVQLTLPVFDGAIRKNRVEQANLEQRQSRLALEDTRNRLAFEVEQAFGGLTEARSRLEVAIQGEKEAEEALRIERLRYHGGESTITDLLAAEAALWAAIVNRLQAGYDITVNQARLLRATGELSPERFRPESAGGDAPEAALSGADDKSDLAPYLAWHRCATECGGQRRAPLHTVSNRPAGLEHPVTQGAMQ